MYVIIIRISRFLTRQFSLFCCGRSEVNVLKEADGPVGALSALFGGGLQSAKLGNISFADPALTRMLSGMLSEISHWQELDRVRTSVQLI